MMYKSEPTNFKPQIDIVACYCICKNKLLYLHRQPHKTHPNHWGPPAGKRSTKETLLQAIIRELREETQIIPNTDILKYHDVYFVKHPRFHYPYHIFKYELKQLPEVLINKNEHQNYTWLTPRQALRLPLVQDEHTSIKLTFNLK